MTIRQFTVFPNKNDTGLYSIRFPNTFPTFLCMAIKILNGNGEKSVSG